MSESGNVNERDIIIEDPDEADMEVVEAETVEDDNDGNISDRGNPNETSIQALCLYLVKP